MRTPRGIAGPSLRARACVLALTLFAALVPATAGAELPAPPVRSAAGGGGVDVDANRAGPCLDDTRRALVREAIRDEVARLRGEGRLPEATRGAAPQLGWPLSAAGGLTDPGYHGISNFVDQDPGFPGQLLDWQCGARTYDQSTGYNHRGVDFFNWPYPFLKMEADQVRAVAAAPGTIVFKEDGNYDRNCGFNTLDWNAVYVMHADGSVAWYGHLKSGSLTPKPIGASVAAGEELGTVGSSGSSTGPHLHLEIYDAEENLQEPYAGPCNSLNAATWWADQRPYHDSAINRLTTGGAAPVLGSCPNAGNPNARTAFSRGERIYFTAYYRDQLDVSQSVYVIRRPDGSIHDSWTHLSDAPHYAASYWYWWQEPFAPLGPDGAWTFEVTYSGRTVVRPFTIGGSPAGRVPGDRPGETPLTVRRAAGGAVRLDWTASCFAADTDYAVYEGDIGDWTSLEARFCTTFAQPSVTLVPDGEATYYLVAPLNGTSEGSLGVDGAGAERPQDAGGGCLPRSIGYCP